MKPHERAEDRLLELLLAVRLGEHLDAEATERLRECILTIGSATADNLNCVKHLEIGHMKPTIGRVGRVRGLKVRGRRILLSNVLHVAECISIPAEVREEFPSLTDAQWKACMRFLTLLTTTLEEDEEARLKGAWLNRE